TSLASLEVSEESFKQAVGTGELTVGMKDSTVSGIGVSTAFRNLRAAFFIGLT
nr:hypothetical protein [Tanacetum cinerariifolium]